ncbi:HEAT repeat domain-containing protein [Vulgatibacter incomptus]|uniref:HEAT repeat protein n=1 Tax=Vulgatibacter incomptus TaxID=1391653 RepID=A0A0K1PHC4_9BACT|nr:HEAT repeat domain-containing protein [Vulgatibacter incomptus]AKU92920.1 HEAT repeat protein [Vulgatibacter incomptus]
MRPILRVVAALACVALATACAKPDPSKAETWFKNLSSKETKVRLDALLQLKKIGDKSAVAAIVPLLKESGEVKVAAVKTLASLGDTAAIPALVEALDVSVGIGSDKATKDANTTNKEIAQALGDLGDKAALDPLLDLASKTKDPFVKAAAVNSIGGMGDAKAVTLLSKIATDDGEETYVTKKAIQALGNIGDPAGVPAIKKGFFQERKGVSFYMESSFAAYQIGLRAADPFLAVLEGKDDDLKKWADDNDIYVEALYAKAGQVLGDLNDRRAIPTLVKQLAYGKGPKSDDSIDARMLIVRRQAADVLGRMRAVEAVPELVKGLKEDEGNVRAVYAQALVSIGDKRALPDLVACALKGEVMEKSIHARKGCYQALSKLGDDKTLAQWEAWEKAEPALSSAACMKGLDYDAKSKDNAQKHCDEVAGNVVKTLAENKSRLVAAAECKDDVSCWAGKLKSEDPKVRERAAMELGRINDPKAMAPLLAAVTDAELEPRYAAILAADWVVSSSKEALEEAKKGLAKLDKQIDQEKDKVHFAKVNQDLTRLAVKIRRLDRIGS